LYVSFGIGASFKQLIYRQRRWKYEAWFSPRNCHLCEQLHVSARRDPL